MAEDGKNSNDEIYSRKMVLHNEHTTHWTISKNP